MQAQPRKTLISIRVQPEVLNWYKSHYKTGYQTAMHMVLSAHAEQQTLHQARVAGRAQELFRRYYAQCFWHYDKNFEIGPQNVQIVIDGLRKYGGREGFLLADELCH